MDTRSRRLEGDEMNDKIFDCDLNKNVVNMGNELDEESINVFPREWITIGYILNRIARDKQLEQLKEGL